MTFAQRNCIIVVVFVYLTNAHLCSASASVPSESNKAILQCICLQLHKEIPRDRIEQLMNISTLHALNDIVKDMGIKAIEAKVGVDTLVSSRLPFIAQLWDQQFVFGQPESDEGFNVTYSSNKSVSIPKNIFGGLYTGHVFIFIDGKQPLPKSVISGPDLAIDDFIYDYKIRNEGEVIVYDFIITNQGTKPLIFTRARSTCECVSASISTCMLQPGEQGKVTVRFNTHGRYGKQSEGVYLHSNDPITPLLPLRLSGILQSSALSVSQRTVDFGALRSAQGETTELTLFDPADLTFQVREVSSSSKSVKYTLLPPDKAHSDYRLDVTLPPGLPVGDFTACLTILTTHHKESTLTIPLHANILPNLDLQPELIHFGRVKQGEAATKQLTLTLYASVPWKIERMSVPVDYVTVETGPQNKESTTLTLRLTEKAPVGTIKTQLVVQTTHPDYHEITIPIYGVVEE